MEERPITTAAELSATPAVRPFWKDPAALVGMLLLVTLGLTLMCRYAIWVGIPFADTLTYLEPGRNLVEGRGLVTRFNVYWGWSESHTYPGLAYCNSLYGIPLGIVWAKLNNPSAVSIIFSVIPAVLNALLIVVLLRRSFGAVVAVLSGTGFVLLPVIYHNLSLITAEHPLITLCLIMLLLVQRLIPRHERWWLLVGAFLGLSFFFRRNVFAAAPAVLIASFFLVEGPLRTKLIRTLRAVVLFAVGALAVYGSGQLICKAVDGKWYPSVQKMVGPHKRAGSFGGEFVAASPAVQANPKPPQERGLGWRLQIAAANLLTYVKLATDQLGLLMLAILAGLVGLSYQRMRDVLGLFLMGLMFLAMYVYTSPGPIADNIGSPMRYTEHIVVFWFPLGIVGLARLVGWLKTRTAWRAVAVVALWLVAVFPALATQVQMQERIGQMTEPRMAAMQRMANAIRELTEDDQLIAVEEGGMRICTATFFDRPVVTLPYGEMDNDADFRRFMEIFHPRVIVPGTCQSARRLLPGMGYQVRLIPSYVAGRDEPIFVWPR